MDSPEQDENAQYGVEEEEDRPWHGHRAEVKAGLWRGTPPRGHISQAGSSPCLAVVVKVSLVTQRLLIGLYCSVVVCVNLRG